MSLNWKEINLILEELSLEGAQIQGAAQTAFDVIVLRVHKRGETKNLLISLNPGACRLHQTFRDFPKSDKPLRFAQFLNSRVVNGWITEASQLADNRIARLIVKRGQFTYKLYIRLWSNAANFIVTDENGVVLDAMRRLPKRQEITGGSFIPESYEKKEGRAGEREIRELEGEGSFNKKIDDYYALYKGSLSLETLKERARRHYEGSVGRISASLETLREKEALFLEEARSRDYDDLIASNIEPEAYYERYRKAKNALAKIRDEIAAGERELKKESEKLERVMSETNPLVLAKLSKHERSRAAVSPAKNRKTRPGLTFVRGDWRIFVGRNASENDELLRRHVKGNDLWLHARGFSGSHVFIKQRAKKTFPLDILLDAGNLAIFYSKGRNNGKGDIVYTHVKYLRRAKDSPKGLVIPTQEKNLSVELDESRLRSLEESRET